MKRIAWVDALKGILILFVVLGHSIQCAYSQLNLDFIHDSLWRAIYSFHMPAFIAVSGYVAFNNNRNRGRQHNVLHSIIRRFRQLFIPYILWSIILFFMQHNVTQIYDYFLYPNKSLWFLWALFFISFIFIIVDWISHECKVPQIVLLGMTSLLLLSLALILDDAKFLGFEYVSYYFFFYILGYYLHKYNIFRNIKIRWVLTLTFIWFVLALFWEAREVPKILNWAYYLPPGLILAGYRIMTAIIAIFALFGAFEKLKGSSFVCCKLFITFGNYSLGIYAMHMVVRNLLSKWIFMVFTGISYPILLVLIFIILLFASWFGVWLIGKNRLTTEFLLGKLR